MRSTPITRSNKIIEQTFNFESINDVVNFIFSHTDFCLNDRTMINLLENVIKNIAEAELRKEFFETYPTYNLGASAEPITDEQRTNRVNALREKILTLLVGEKISHYNDYVTATKEKRFEMLKGDLLKLNQIIQVDLNNNDPNYDHTPSIYYIKATCDKYNLKASYLTANSRALIALFEEWETLLKTSKLQDRAHANVKKDQNPILYCYKETDREHITILYGHILAYFNNIKAKNVNLFYNHDEIKIADQNKALHALIIRSVHIFLSHECELNEKECNYIIDTYFPEPDLAQDVSCVAERLSDGIKSFIPYAKELLRQKQEENLNAEGKVSLENMTALLDSISLQGSPILPTSKEIKKTKPKDNTKTPFLHHSTTFKGPQPLDVPSLVIQFCEASKSVVESEKRASLLDVCQLIFVGNPTNMSVTELAELNSIIESVLDDISHSIGSNPKLQTMLDNIKLAFITEVLKCLESKDKPTIKQKR